MYIYIYIQPGKMLNFLGPQNLKSGRGLGPQGPFGSVTV